MNPRPIRRASTTKKTVKKVAKKCGGTKKPKPRQTAVYQKTITVTLTGSNKEELQEVAHNIHKMSHPLLVGGKNVRKVTMKHNSTTPSKIFDGVI